MPPALIRFECHSGASRGLLAFREKSSTEMDSGFRAAQARVTTK